MTQPYYCAPEFQPIDRRAEVTEEKKIERAGLMEKADVYSLGLTIYSVRTSPKIQIHIHHIIFVDAYRLSFLHPSP